MRKIFQIIFLSLLVLVHINTNAQIPLPCGTAFSKDSKYNSKDFEQYQRNHFRKTTINLPIVFHIVRASNGSGGANYSGIQSQLVNTNQQYANSNLSFSECASVEYINNDNLYDFQQAIDEGTLLTHNVANVINVYYVNSVLTSSNLNVGGYSNFPWDPNPQKHYIIIAIGNSLDNSTLSHEMGHFFGLYHPHETALGVENVARSGQNANCSIAGDLLCDTPADPDLQNCSNSSCQYTCTSLTDPVGQHYSPMMNNLMSYAYHSTNSSCGQIFTTQQNARINFYYTSSRSYLSCGATPPSNDNCPGTLLTSSTTCNYLSDQTVNNATPSGKPRGSCDFYSGTPDLDDVWYYFQAVGTSTTITVDPNGSSLDAVIVAYNSCSDNTQVGCSDTQGGNGILSTLTIPTVPGNTYYIRVYDYGLQTTNGGFRICVTHSGGSTCTDQFEPNNKVNTATNVFATPLSTSSVNYPLQGNIGYVDDVDWYKVNIGSCGTLTVNLSNLPYNYDLELWNAAGTTALKGSYNTGTANESVTFNYPGSDVAYLKVYSVKPATDYTTSSCYNLQFLWTSCSGCTTSAPVAIAPSNITTTSFQANWTTVPGATSYNIDVATDANLSNKIYSDVPGNPGYLSLNAFTCNTTYYYRVRASNGCTSVNSNVISVTTLPCSVCTTSAPVAIAPSNITTTSFQANWSTVAGANGYNVDVATDASFSNIIYNNVAGNPGYLSINALTCNTTYYYRVRATNGCVSSNSNVISVTTSPCCAALSAPTANVASNITATSFLANWSTVSGALGYNVDVASDASFSNIIYNNVAGNPGYLSINALTCNTTYYYRVRASNSCGPSNNSVVVSVTTSACCTAPPAPVATAASSITTTSFQANWSIVSGATSYNVDVATDANFSNIIYPNVSSGSEFLNINTLSCGTTYYYRVKAVNSCGPSNNSATISVITSPCCSQFTTPVILPAGPVNLCPGQSVTLSISNPCSGCTYHWSDGSTGLTNSATANGSYYAQAINTCNQPSANSNTVVVNINSAIANAGPDKTICIGSSTTIGSSASGNNTYSWSPATGLSNPNIANPVANPTTTTTYTLTVTNSSGCMATSSVAVTVANIPLLLGSISGSKNPCEGSQQTYSVSSIPGATYTWILPLGWGGASNTNSINVVVGAAGSATIQVTASNICGNGSTLSLPVFVNSHSVGADSIKVNPSTTICSGNSVQMTVAGGSLGVGATWNWYTVSCGTGPLNLSGSSITVSPAHSTNYFVTAENGCGITNCASVSITVNQTPPTPTPVPGFLEVCADNQVKLLANTTEDSYLWNGPNGFTSTMQNPIVSNTIGGTGKYCLVVTRLNCPSSPGCDSLKFDPLTPTSITIWQEKCFDSSVVFHSSITGGGTGPGYRWQVKNYNSNLWIDSPNGQADTFRLDHASNGMQVRCIMASNAVCPRPIFAISDSNLITCLSKKQPLPQIDCLKEFTVLPNPNRGSFDVIINLGCQKTIMFQLYNSNGQKVYEHAGVLMNRQVTTPFQLGQLTSGIYFLKTWVNEQSFIYRIFIGH